jgi:hypothetical protein
LLRVELKGRVILVQHESGEITKALKLFFRKRAAKKVPSVLA